MNNRIGKIAVLGAIVQLAVLASPARPVEEASAKPLNVLVLLGEWFGDAYFPLAKEIEARGWTMKRVGVDVEYRGCYNKSRDIVLRSDILIPDLKDLGGYDCLIIPSGPRFRKFKENPLVLDFVRRAHASGLLVASFCVGNYLVQAAGLVDGLAGQDTFPKQMTLARERVLIGPRGGGPPPGDGFESAPIKELCDTIVRELTGKTGTTRRDPDASDGGQTASMPGTFLTLTGESRSVREADIFLAGLMKSSPVSALSVAVVKDGRVVFERVLGLVNQKTGRTAGPDTVFRAASLSKPVFSYLVMKLVDEGFLALDQPLKDYVDPPFTSYPEYASLEGDPRLAGLTPAVLLSHASGFPNWRRQRWTGPLTFLFDPGREFSYSGEGYHLLQFLIEKKTGRGLASLAKEKVFDPLGMARTSFLWEDRFDPDFAVDLDAGLGPLIRRSKTRAVSAGSLVTNASDYAKFVLAAMDGRGLKPETAAAWRRPRMRVGGRALHDRTKPDTTLNEDVQLSWTPGWGWFHCPAGAALFHVGAEEGCENYVVVFPEKRMGIAIFSVSREPARVTPLIVGKLLDDVYSPFAWMHY